MRTSRLNQTIAIEKGVKTRVYAAITDLHKATQKQEMLDGFSKAYTPLNEGGDVLPPESKRVQYHGGDVFKQVTKLCTELFDVTAQKDWANCTAKADVVVDGVALLTQVPATYLLFLDKQLSDLLKFVSSFGELDPASDWAFDTASGLYKTPPVKSRRTEKRQKAIVLYDATDKHPAQTQLITEDAVVGYWETTRFSGALPRTKKIEILDRIQKLINAVKQALEQANQVDAPTMTVGATVLGFLFGDVP